MNNDMHNYHHQHDSWSTYNDHSNNYKMKVNGVRSNHYYPQQQQLILSDGPSSSNIYCTQPQTQYDMRTIIPPMTTTTAAASATTTANLPNSYGK
jgi:hypothetical protein